MRIGIIGSGNIGDAAAFGEIVLIEIPLHAYDSLPAAAFEDKVVIDAGNHYPGRDGAYNAPMTAPEAERALDAA